VSFDGAHCGCDCGYKSNGIRIFVERDEQARSEDFPSEREGIDRCCIGWVAVLCDSFHEIAIARIVQHGSGAFSVAGEHQRDQLILRPDVAMYEPEIDPGDLGDLSHRYVGRAALDKEAVCGVGHCLDDLCGGSLRSHGAQSSRLR
jgi:hypothetical protein